jgi:hypothetical protein
MRGATQRLPGGDTNHCKCLSCPDQALSYAARGREANRGRTTRSSLTLDSCTSAGASAAVSLHTMQGDEIRAIGQQDHAGMVRIGPVFVATASGVRAMRPAVAALRRHCNARRLRLRACWPDVSKSWARCSRASASGLAWSSRYRAHAAVRLRRRLPMPAAIRAAYRLALGHKNIQHIHGRLHSRAFLPDLEQ